MLSTLSLLVLGSLPSLPGSQGLDPVWYDGQAEVSGYRWSGQRYGEERTGEAVAIFVTEPFSPELAVKIDRPDEVEGDVTTALKLNLVRDFQTGIYDYNTMTSVFVRADDLSLMKSTFSSAEWCGHVFEQIDVRGGAPTIDKLSYFQGESGTTNLPARPGGLVGEQILVWLRGLHGAPLEPGESVSRPFVRGSFERRLQHRRAEWHTAHVERGESTETVEVPAGRFEAIPYSVSVHGQGKSLGSAVVHIEAAAPHRLLSWRWSSEGFSDAGELTGSERMPYWQLHRVGHERLRESIGLEAR